MQETGLGRSRTFGIRYGVTILVATGWITVAHGDTPTAEDIAAGKQLAMARDKGNCLACHAFDDGELPGTLGPPLLSMKLRFPDRTELFDQIWDATRRNPDTVMPPFGKHGILTTAEIDLIVDYLYTL